MFVCSDWLVHNCLVGIKLSVHDFDSHKPFELFTTLQDEKSHEEAVDTYTFNAALPDLLCCC